MSKIARWFLWGWWLLLPACAGPRVEVQPEPTAPPMRVSLSRPAVEPGQALRVRVENVSPGSRICLQGLETDCALVGNSRTPAAAETWLAVPLETAPGYVSLTITAAVENQAPVRMLAELQILPRSPYKTSWLHIKNFSLKRYEKESRLFAETRKHSPGFSGLPLTEFIWPVRGRLTEQFGTKRIYNEGISPWYHSGLDIAAPKGTTITAPADGIVLLAGMFKAHGGTVLMDHGFGVTTAYLHQSAIYVKPGDQLRQGDPIGAVGSTGGSTGNHLHFQVNIHGRVASPWTFLPSLSAESFAAPGSGE